MTRPLLPLLAATTLLNSAAPAAVTFTFDDFRDAFTAGTLVVSSGTPSATTTETLTVPDTAGSSRASRLVFNSGLQGAEATILGNDLLDLSIDPLATATLTVNYDFTNFGPTGVNAAINGGNIVEVDLVSSDAPPNLATLKLTITSFGGAMAIQSVALSPIGIVQIPFANFAGVNFSQVTGMTLAWDGGQSFDGQISSVRVSGGGAPEPAFACVFGVLAGFPLLRRRRSR